MWTIKSIRGRGTVQKVMLYVEGTEWTKRCPGLGNLAAVIDAEDAESSDAEGWAVVEKPIGRVGFKHKGAWSWPLSLDNSEKKLSITLKPFREQLCKKNHQARPDARHTHWRFESTPTYLSDLVSTHWQGWTDGALGMAQCWCHRIMESTLDWGGELGGSNRGRLWLDGKQGSTEPLFVCLWLHYTLRDDYIIDSIKIIFAVKSNLLRISIPSHFLQTSLQPKNSLRSSLARIHSPIVDTWYGAIPPIPQKTFMIPRYFSPKVSRSSYRRKPKTGNISNDDGLGKSPIFNGLGSSVRQRSRRYRVRMASCSTRLNVQKSDG